MIKKNMFVKINSNLTSKDQNHKLKAETNYNRGMLNT